MAPLITSKAIDSALTQLSGDFARNRVGRPFETDRAPSVLSVATPRSVNSNQQPLQPVTSEKRESAQPKRLSPPTTDIFSHWEADVLNDFDL